MPMNVVLSPEKQPFWKGETTIICTDKNIINNNIKWKQAFLHFFSIVILHNFIISYTRLSSPHAAVSIKKKYNNNKENSILISSYFVTTILLLYFSIIIIILFLLYFYLLTTIIGWSS